MGLKSNYVPDNKKADKWGDYFDFNGFRHEDDDEDAMAGKAMKAKEEAEHHWSMTASPKAARDDLIQHVIKADYYVDKHAFFRLKRDLKKFLATKH